MRLSFDSDALAEIETARDFHAAVSIELAVSFVEEIASALERIKDAPQAWASYTRNTRRCQLKRFPYHLVFRIRSDDIVIVAVAHTKRDPAYWLGRLAKHRP
jgi:toxin ParE2